MSTAVTSSAMERAGELLHTMTIEEKAMQLSAVYPLALARRGPCLPVRRAGRIPES